MSDCQTAKISTGLLIHDIVQFNTMWFISPSMSTTCQMAGFCDLWVVLLFCLTLCDSSLSLMVCWMAQGFVNSSELLRDDSLIVVDSWSFHLVCDSSLLDLHERCFLDHHQLNGSGFHEFKWVIQTSERWFLLLILEFACIQYVIHLFMTCMRGVSLIIVDSCNNWSLHLVQ